MDPDCFAMSSYQFVNSLASCYPQTQMGGVNQPGHQASSTGTNNNSSGATTGVNQPGAGAGGGNEYFPSAYTPNLYPSTPQAHYTNQAYNLGGQQAQADMVDYTQLQPQRLLLPNQQQQQQPPQNQQQQQQQQQSQLSTPSCKYAAEATATVTGNNNTSISSPQDLTTARDISPKLSPNSVVESVARSLNKTTANNVATTNITNNHSTTGLTNNNSHTTSVPLHSPGDSDTSSDSGNEGGGSSQGGPAKKGSAPPQIYPWMKRVHIGQSKYTNRLNIYICFCLGKIIY